MVAVRYADDLRHHEPFHFEAPSKDMRQSAEFTRRMDQAKAKTE